MRETCCRRQDLPQSHFIPATTAGIELPAEKFWNFHPEIHSNLNFWRTTAGKLAKDGRMREEEV